MVRLFVGCLLLCGCGRVGFDAVARDDGGAGFRLTYPSSDIDAILDQSVVSFAPTTTATALQFSVSPALPAGLDLDSSTGILAGTPSAMVDAVAYTITAANAFGSATFALQITVLPGSVVDSTADLPDDDGGVDTTCFATAAGGCTLRAAVQTANHRTTKQLIVLDAQTYRLGSTLDAVTNDLELAGRGVSATTIRAATVQPGFGMISLATAHTLSLRTTSFDDFGMANGAVVSATAGTLEVDRCSFTNNASAGSGGVFFMNGGSTSTIRRSTFTSNSSFGGCCGGWGGVIDGEDAGTTIVVEQCTATLNSTAWGAFAHITTGTTLRLENSTLYGNTSNTAGTLATPGGIYTLVNDTIVYNTNTNSTPDSAGIYLYQAPCHYTVTNSIVAFNTDGTGAEHDCNRRDLSTTITSNGGNILGDAAGNCAAYFTAPGDRLTTDPRLDPSGLADNGGPTQTVLLSPTSPAIHAAQSAGCPSEDQRGLPRPASCDVGAVEMQ